ncbi:hypothetical protein BDZ89DRAFT_1150243 [Hymenopellis radicata]|nr:hypothetical protein BDZ89DRAFT_1150243 [Hymenopellis radicata]
MMTVTEMEGVTASRFNKLRAAAFINLAGFYEKTNLTYVQCTLWPVIALDLAYVSETWNLTTFDLWAELSSSSFWTATVQHHALRQGIELGKAIGSLDELTVKKYTTEAERILCFMQSFWNPSDGYMSANLGGGRTGAAMHGPFNHVLAGL